MKERRRESESWIIAGAFPNMNEARQVYEQARDLLLLDDLDASVIRFQFKGTNFVAVIGETPLSGEGLAHVNEVLSAGEPSVVAPAVADHLRERRRHFKHTNLDFLERRRGETPDE